MKITFEVGISGCVTLEKNDGEFLELTVARHGHKASVLLLGKEARRLGAILQATE
jgi:hypothetical protein